MVPVIAADMHSLHCYTSISTVTCRDTNAYLVDVFTNQTSVLSPAIMALHLSLHAFDIVLLVRWCNT